MHHYELLMSDLTEQVRVLESRGAQLLTEYDRACQDRDAMQGKVREQVYRVQKHKEEVEERAEKIE